MGEFNQAVILDAIRRAPHGATRADLARSTGLSPQTVTNVTRRLIERSLVLEGEVSRNGPGRPGTPLRLNPRGAFTVGVHLDPAAIVLVAMDFAGHVVARERLATPATGAPQDVLEVLATGIDGLIEGCGLPRRLVAGVGIATPGPVDTEKGTVVDPPHLRAWHDVPVRDEVARRTGLPTLLDKDVIAAASAHLWSAPGEGTDNWLFVYLGTGVAMAPIVGGDVVRGVSGNAGEAHHLVVDPDGPVCHVGHRGCLGAALTSGGLAAEAIAAGVPAAPVDADLGEPAVADGAATELCRLAAEGDERAVAVLETAARRLARGVTTLCDLLDLDAVVVGGETWGRLAPWLAEPLAAALAAHAVPGAKHALALRSSRWGADVAAVGAASLMLDDAFTPHPSDLLITRAPAVV